MLALAAVVPCFLLLLPLTWAQCLPEGSPTLDGKVAGSDVVVQGYSTRMIESGGRQLELKVDCVYKGGPLPDSIIVTSGPDGQATCVLNTLVAKRRTYLVYLTRQNSSLFPAFNADPDEPRYLDELEMVCGLQVQLPTGVSSSKTCTPEKFQSEENEDCGGMLKTVHEGNAATTTHDVHTLHCTLAMLTAVILTVQYQ